MRIRQFAGVLVLLSTPSLDPSSSSFATTSHWCGRGNWFTASPLVGCVALYTRDLIKPCLPGTLCSALDACQACDSLTMIASRLIIYLHHVWAAVTFMLWTQSIQQKKRRSQNSHDVSWGTRPHGIKRSVCLAAKQTACSCAKGTLSQQ